MMFTSQLAEYMRDGMSKCEDKGEGEDGGIRVGIKERVKVGMGE